MAVNLGDFNPDEIAIEELLRDPAGPVGQLILELSEKAADVARAKAHTFPGTPGSTVWNPDTSTAVLPSGTTRRSVETHFPQLGSRGGMFGGVDAAGIPTIFLEYRPLGARQMYDRYPFMTSGLDALIGTVL